MAAETSPGYDNQPSIHMVFLQPQMTTTSFGGKGGKDGAAYTAEKKKKKKQRKWLWGERGEAMGGTGG